MEQKTVYMGFKENTQNRNQFKVGETYAYSGCDFLAWENPLYVLDHSPSESWYCRGVLEGEKVHIVEEISVSDIVEAGTKYILNRARTTKSDNGSNHSVQVNTRDYSLAKNKGLGSVAANTGEDSVASCDDYGSVAANTGYDSVAKNNGLCSVASNTGSYSVAKNKGAHSIAINVGECSVASSGGLRSVAVNTGEYSVASSDGPRSIASNTGNCSVSINKGEMGIALATEYCSAALVTGADAIAIATGHKSKASGAIGSYIVVAEYGLDGNIGGYRLLDVKLAKVDGIKIKANTYYTLLRGEFVEVENNE